MAFRFFCALSWQIDPDYSINDSPIAEDTYELMLKAVKMIRNREESSIDDIGDILDKIGTRLNAILIHQ